MACSEAAPGNDVGFSRAEKPGAVLVLGEATIEAQMPAAGEHERPRLRVRRDGVGTAELVCNMGATTGGAVSMVATLDCDAVGDETQTAPALALFIDAITAADGTTKFMLTVFPSGLPDLHARILFGDGEPPATETQTEVALMSRGDLRADPFALLGWAASGAGVLVGETLRASSIDLVQLEIDASWTAIGYASLDDAERSEVSIGRFSLLERPDDLTSALVDEATLRSRALEALDP